MRVGIVVHRYGLEVNGGAELLCRMTAERLSRHAEIEVITSCAVDYLTWRDEYDPGLRDVNGVPVRRFPVDFTRSPDEFNRHSAWLFANSHTVSDEQKWMRLQGPYSTKLFDYLSSSRTRFDAFIFFTYLYPHACLGLPIVQDRAVLVPTAHDEPPIYLRIFNEMFRRARGILCLTPEERDFVLRRFCLDERAAEIVSVGVEPPTPDPTDDSWAKLKSRLGAENLIVYVGRIDESKGCRTMLDYFQRYSAERRPGYVKLLLVGKAAMTIPEHPGVVQAGFISESAKFQAIQACRVLLMPSPYESLSLVLLEAWAVGKPVLVNARSEVLVGQCRRSNGGLWYRDYEEFAACLDRLLGDDELRASLGEQGRSHVTNAYCWERVEQHYMETLTRIVE